LSSKAHMLDEVESHEAEGESAASGPLSQVAAVMVGLDLACYSAHSVHISTGGNDELHG
jgi:hypothetical protein